MSASSTSQALETGCIPSKVVIQLATQVVIPNYSRDFSSIPIEDFKPSYLAMDDGSLLAAPLMLDVKAALLSVIFLSILLVFFVRNIVVTGYYYFSRSKIIHDRRLFLALFVSQLVSPAGILPTMISYFDASGDCTTILRFERCVKFFSLSILIYGILGFKAYRVLEDSRAVIAVATILQLGATAVLGLEVTGTEGHRRLSGSCALDNIPKVMLGSVSIQLAQVIFVAICFIIAILKARADTEGVNYEERGRKTTSPVVALAAQTLGSGRWFRSSPTPTPPRNSVVSRLTQFVFDSMFHRVMRDELRFTLLIVVLSTVSIAFPLVGLNYENLLSVQGWLAIPWCFISLVVIKTFDRSLARHEQEVAHWNTPSPVPAIQFSKGSSSEKSSSLEFTPASELGSSTESSLNPFADPRPHSVSSIASSQFTAESSMYATETVESHTQSAYEVMIAHSSASERTVSRKSEG